MALPTRNQVRTSCLQWLQAALQANERPRLPKLRAQLARLITAPDSDRASVASRVAGTPEFPQLTLVITLQRWDAQGEPLADMSLTYDATDIPPNAVMADFDDIVDDFSGKRSRREHRNGLLAKLIGQSLVGR